jgi:hypothetical protein
MTPRLTDRTARRGLFLVLQLAMVIALPCASLAGSRKLPPDVDLDPDRGMSFGRLPKTAFDRRVFDPMKKSLGSRVMDPAVDPYNPVVRPSRYEPGTGRIRDSLTDKLRDMRHDEEVARKSRDTTRKKDEKTAAASMPHVDRGPRPPVNPMAAMQKASRADDDD